MAIFDYLIIKVLKRSITMYLVFLLFQRENTRNVQPPGNVSLGERYGMGRGFPGRGFLGRGSGQLEGRGRSRRSYIRQPPAVR